jgi:hypothetical protein
MTAPITGGRQTLIPHTLDPDFDFDLDVESSVLSALAWLAAVLCSAS